MMTTTHVYRGFVFTITYRVEEPGSDLLICNKAACVA